MRTTERQKQRQDYVKRKAGASSVRIIVRTLFLFSFICAVVSGLFTVLTLVRGVNPFTMGLVISTLFFAGWSWYVYPYVRMADRDVRSLPYVPPVTPDTLPAEELLVRGAERPPTEESIVLLRAAGESVETPAEELLRPAGANPANAEVAESSASTQDERHAR